MHAFHMFKYNKILSISDIFLCFSEEFPLFCMHLSDAFDHYKWYIFYNRCCPFLTRCCIFFATKAKNNDVLKRQKTQTLQRLSLESEHFFLEVLTLKVRAFLFFVESFQLLRNSTLRKSSSDQPITRRLFSYSHHHLSKNGSVVSSDSALIIVYYAYRK